MNLLIPSLLCSSGSEDVFAHVYNWQFTEKTLYSDLLLKLFFELLFLDMGITLDGNKPHGDVLVFNRNETSFLFSYNPVKANSS